MVAVIGRDPQVPTEAAQAIERARRARLSSEAVLPMAEKVRDESRELLAGNHFTDLILATLERVAARR